MGKPALVGHASFDATRRAEIIMSGASRISLLCYGQWGFQSHTDATEALAEIGGSSASHNGTFDEVPFHARELHVSSKTKGNALGDHRAEHRRDDIA